VDEIVTRWINAAAGNNHIVDASMVAVTTFGVPFIVICVVLQWWSKSDRLPARHAAIAAGLSFLLGLGVNQIVLLVVHRVRPYDVGLTHLVIAPSIDWSFPSDHATAAFAVAAAFALQLLPRRALFFSRSRC
jgi:undecaprenyl-diphosphatase